MYSYFEYSITTTFKGKESKQQKKAAQSTETKLSQINNQHVMSGNNDIKHYCVKLPEIEIEESIEKAQTSAICTYRGDNKHQALVCLVCDWLIIVTETIHLFSKEWLLMHQHRLNSKSYQDFNNGETLNPILVQQYSVDDIPGVLLSPRSYKSDNDHFECCS